MTMSIARCIRDVCAALVSLPFLFDCHSLAETRDRGYAQPELASNDDEYNKFASSSDRSHVTVRHLWHSPLLLKSLYLQCQFA